MATSTPASTSQSQSQSSQSSSPLLLRRLRDRLRPRPSGPKNQTSSTSPSGIRIHSGLNHPATMSAPQLPGYQSPHTPTFPSTTITSTLTSHKSSNLSSEPTIFLTRHEGTECFDTFDTRIKTDAPEKDEISQIAVSSDGNYVTSLELKYRGREHQSALCGRRGAQATSFDLIQGEWITKINLGTARCVICSITFTTNLNRTHGPFGGEKAITHLTMQGPDPRYGLLWLNGTYGVTCLSSIQAAFVKYSPLPNCSAILRFERGQKTSFFEDLRSPIATLIVGPPASSETLSIRESILVRLPFFRAALQGSFSESITKTIHMPEDDPTIISALLEYLSTGHYTYCYDTPEQLPCADIQQALFHLRVSGCAKKYDCRDLGEAALLSFVGVVEELDGVSMVKLLQGAYELGMGFTEVFPKGVNNLRLRLREVYKAAPEMMGEIVEQWPELRAFLEDENPAQDD